MSIDQTRTYRREESIVVLKTDEPFGGLSNMAGGFPLRVNGLHIRTSEALYQACRFPHLPDVQKLIIEQKSPMTAKMKSKPHRKNSRPDWDRVRVKIMRWCLRVKLAQNWTTFSKLLQETGDRPIVEESRKDAFWGAKPVDADTLVGMNVLGRLLMELRAAIVNVGRESLLQVDSLDIPEFLLAGNPIETVITRDAAMVPIRPPDNSKWPGEASSPSAYQPSLFDSPKGSDTMVRDSAAERPAQAAIAGLTPYPAMRDSGVPWLGEVPVHWEVRRLKYLLRERDTRSADGSEQLLRVSQFTGVTERKRDDGGDEPDTRAASLVGYKRVQPNDLVVNIMLAWNGSMGVSSFNGIASPAYCVYKFGPHAHPWFFHYLLRSPPYKARVKAVSTGVVESRLRLYTDDLYRLEALLPPLPEQAAIVRFLDYADRRIRRYVRAKQKLIKLLEEQKQAIIHLAVTRGLDPNVRLKPSGVECLGDVPEHWEVRRLKTLVTRIDQGISPQAENYLADGESWGVLKSGCVNRGVFRQDEHKRLPLGFAFDSALVVRDGDVLVSRASGSPHLVGSVGRVVSLAYKLILSDKTFRPVFEARVSPDFMVLAMNSRYYRQQVERAISGAEGLANNLPLSSLRSFVFAIPPEAEQRAIVEDLREAIRTEQATAARVEREIALLREYRTRLIADVVTGKLDVREAAARLPDEADEPERLDEAENLPDGDEATTDDLDTEPEEAEV